MGEENRIRSFKDLEAWKRGHALVLSIYRITKRYPRDEQFGITNQLRRAAVSVTSNIAEGFSRQTSKEKAQFYAIAKGSLTEIENQLLVSRDVHYVSIEDFERVETEIEQTSRLITGLLKYVRAQNV
ncbi:MAG: four helix bundle protein [Patescibacteria group bacterium]